MQPVNIQERGHNFHRGGSMAIDIGATEIDVIEKLLDGFMDMNHCHQVALRILCRRELLGEYYDELSKIDSVR